MRRILPKILLIMLCCMCVSAGAFAREDVDALRSAYMAAVEAPGEIYIQRPVVAGNFSAGRLSNEAQTQALAYAAAQGYTVAVAYVREDNLPSIRLHEKLGFELDAPYTGRNQKRMRLYIKALAANSTEICSTEQKIQEKNHA